MRNGKSQSQSETERAVRQRVELDGGGVEGIKARADYAERNYSRLGSSWAGFYGRDIRCLLAQLKTARKKLEAEIKVVAAAKPSETGRDDSYYRGRLSGLLYVRDRILKGGE